MNKFCLTELPNNQMQFDVTGDKGEIASMIYESMRNKQDIREIVLAAVIVWSTQTGNDLIEIIRKGTAVAGK